MNDWLGNLPSGWSVANPRHHFRERREASRSEDVHLTPSQHYGVLSQADYMARTGTKVVLNLSAPDNMKRVQPGDFIAHLRSFQGGLEKSGLAGKVSTAYTVIQPLPSVEPCFYRWVLKSPAYIQVLASSLEQLRDGQSIKFGDFAAIRLPKPPLDEQRRIADFLDYRVARIDQIIAARSQQIAALRERWSLELESVLASIPDTTRASRLVRVLPGYAFPSNDFSTQESDRRLLRGVNVGVGLTRWEDVVYWPEDRVDEAREFVLQVGDLVLGMDRPWIGGGLRIARVSEGDGQPLLLQRVAKVSSREITTQYLYWAYQSRRFRDQVESDLTGLSVPHLSGDQIGSFELPICDERRQAEIVSALDAGSASTKALIAVLDRSNERLAEYKQSLITAAVTGEIDVTTAGSGIQG